jgi:organic hydroperoxide reductase OsmC/OhrA
MAVKAKELRYAIDLQPDATLRTDGGAPLSPGQEWTPEHLLLAALVRCTLKSLRHHAERAALRLGPATAAASSLVTRRESDGRYAQTEATVELAVELRPLPDSDELAELLAKAERDCFVGASLTAPPAYRWTVNGEPARRA